MSIFFSCTETRKTVIDTSLNKIISSDKVYIFDSVANWEDNFSYNGLPDPTKWGYDLGGGGWGNSELQNYTNNNATVADSNLTITSKKEASGGLNYSSTRLISKGKGDFLYGRLVIRAKLPPGKGTWPAFWLLPTDKAYGEWPKSGEVDIMEAVGSDPNKIINAIHTQSYNGSIGTQKDTRKTIVDAYNTYHTYRLDWSPYSLKFYTDDVQSFEYVNDGKGSASWPYDKKFHIILNTAIGGTLGGQIDDTIFPTTFTIDYVKYFPCKNCTAN